ncbi:MAG TPA: peroxiredoxin, partial [Chloroflexota bacterium]|nr:peroxiredoxin [Chloroflexota bacterium]
GCTPESCGFRDHYGELRVLGANVFGMSTQTIEEQNEARERLGLPFDILSDRELRLAHALNLPTFEVEGRVMLKRLTMIVRAGAIERVFYPIFPPDKHAGEVVAWLEEHPL